MALKYFLLIFIVSQYALYCTAQPPAQRSDVHITIHFQSWRYTKGLEQRIAETRLVLERLKTLNTQ